MRRDLQDMAHVPRHILVVRTCGLGDFILSTPAFRALRLRFPHSRISLLTLQSTERATSAKVAAYAGGKGSAPWVDLVHPHLIDDVLVLPDVRSPASLRTARMRLRADRPDLVIQMIDVGVPWRRRLKKLLFIFALLGPVRQLGWRRPGVVKRGRVPKIDPGLGHHVFGPLQFLNELDGQSDRNDDVVFDLRPGPDALDWADQWISRHVPSGKRLVGIAPGALHPHKQWTACRFAELAARLAELHHDLVFVVTGTATDNAAASSIQSKVGADVHNLCGQSSVAQSAAIYANCALVVGNDGGAMHLADAMGAPVVSIVPGIEFPVSIEPWHNQHLAVRLPIACAPCYSFTFCPEGHNRCMRDIAVEAVLDKCEAAL